MKGFGGIIGSNGGIRLQLGGKAAQFSGIIPRLGGNALKLGGIHTHPNPNFSPKLNKKASPQKKGKLTQSF